MPDKLDVLVSVCAEALRTENEVVDRLTKKAEKYLTAIGIILGFHVIEFQGFTFSRHLWLTACSVLVVAGWGLLGLAVVAAVESMRNREYAAYPKTDDLLRLGAGSVDDQTAKRSVAKLYLELRDGILAVNQRRAREVTIAGILTTTGFLASVVGQIGLRLH